MDVQEKIDQNLKHGDRIFEKVSCPKPHKRANSMNYLVNYEQIKWREKNVLQKMSEKG